MAMTVMSYMAGNPNQQLIMKSLPIIKLFYKPSQSPFLNTQIVKTSRQTDCCATSQVGIHFKLFNCHFLCIVLK